MRPCNLKEIFRKRYFRFSFFCLFCFVICALIIFLSFDTAHSVIIELAWDKNEEVDLAGYKVFCRAEDLDYDYNAPAWLGTDPNESDPNCSIEIPDDGKIYCFVARAFDIWDNESDNSNEVCYSPTGNLSPKAVAGEDRDVNEGETVYLDGSGSYDPDGSIVYYTWTQTAGSIVTLSDPNDAAPSFTAPPVGASGETLTFQLEVTDDGGLKDADTINISVSDLSESPIADAGDDQTVNEEEAVSLDGGGSYDPDGSIVDYLWTQTAGTTVTLSDPNDVTPSFTAPYVGSSGVTLIFQLTVTDNDGFESTDTCEVNVVNSIPNLAPVKPIITSPSDGEEETELMPLVTIGSYSDPEEDSHGQTRWQVSRRADFAMLSLDITSADHLTELTVPQLVLDPNTTYYVRAQFSDTYGDFSEWSDAIEFRTDPASNDANNNGIPDTKEVPSGTDLNADGMIDANQPEIIKCIQLPDGFTNVGIYKVSSSINAIEVLDTIDPSTILDNANRPSDLSFGLFSYRLHVATPGDTAVVRIYFSDYIPFPPTFYKYDTVNGWQDFSDDVTFNADGKSLTLTIQDGGEGDSDGVANGIIVDPGGVVSTTSSLDNASQIEAGCFISTLDFGT